MKTILATGGAGGEELKELLQEAGAGGDKRPELGGGSAEASEREPHGVVVIDAPLSDSYGTELALRLCEYHDCTVLMICRRDLYEKVCLRLGAGGVFLMTKPFTKRSALELFRAVFLHREIADAKDKKTAGLVKKLEDIKVIERAKYTLMEYLNISEVEAHRYIEKQAMDGRKTKRQVADGILKTYM